MGRLPVEIALAGDDQAHRVLMERLADAVLGDGEHLEEQRRFVGDAAGRRILPLTRRPARERAPSGRLVHRNQRLGTEPLGYAAVLVEAATDLASQADVVLVLADEDGDRGRKDHLPRARAALHARGLSRIALGICDPIAEAWLVALLAKDRTQRAHALSRALGIDVSRQPERLSSRPPDHRRHAKRALAFLLAHRGDDIMAFPAETPGSDETDPALAMVSLSLEALCALDGCGLADFVCDLERALSASASS